MAELLPWLRDWGSAGAVILVVFLFLKHMKDRDESLNTVLRDLTKAINDGWHGPNRDR